MTASLGFVSRLADGNNPRDPALVAGFWGCSDEGFEVVGCTGGLPSLASLAATFLALTCSRKYMTSRLERSDRDPSGSSELKRRFGLDAEEGFGTALLDAGLIVE